MKVNLMVHVSTQVSLIPLFRYWFMWFNISELNIDLACFGKKCKLAVTIQ